MKNIDAQGNTVVTQPNDVRPFFVLQAILILFQIIDYIV
jgi:hypothetical protein